jgi:DNA-binding NarL/FixJ family response regulator
VLQLVAEGLTNPGIANRLYLSERTVDAHVRHVLVKLGIPDGEDDHRRADSATCRADALNRRSDSRPQYRLLMRGAWGI